MPALPILSGEKVIKVLNKIGYHEIRQRGSHIRLYCSGRKPVTVPNYKILDRFLLKKILRDAEIEIALFLKLFNE